jgi:hypothetical protein
MATALSYRYRRGDRCSRSRVWCRVGSVAGWAEPRAQKKQFHVFYIFKRARHRTVTSGRQRLCRELTSCVVPLPARGAGGAARTALGPSGSAEPQAEHEAQLGFLAPWLARARSGRRTTRALARASKRRARGQGARPGARERSGLVVVLAICEHFPRKAVIQSHLAAARMGRMSCSSTSSST